MNNSFIPTIIIIILAAISALVISNFIVSDSLNTTTICGTLTKSDYGWLYFDNCTYSEKEYNYLFFATNTDWTEPQDTKVWFSDMKGYRYTIDDYIGEYIEVRYYSGCGQTTLMSIEVIE